MNNEQVDRCINEISAALIREDPELASRFRLLDGHNALRDRLVFSLLAASMALLGYGLAMQEGASFLTGGVAFVASFVVDSRFERRSSASSQREQPAPAEPGAPLDCNTPHESAARLRGTT